MILAFRTMSQCCRGTVDDFAISRAVLHYCLITWVLGVSKTEAGLDIDVRDEKTGDLVFIIEARIYDFFGVLLVQGWQTTPHRLEDMKVTKEISAP